MEYGSYVKITDCHFSMKINDSLDNSTCKWKMKISNLSRNSLEYHYSLPFCLQRILLYYEVNYNDNKKLIYFRPSEEVNLIKYDDDIASGNFTIHLKEENSSSTILELTNFPPHSNIYVTVSFLINLLYDESNCYLTIPPVESFNSFLHPNYSISIKLSSKEINLSEIKLWYNNEDHTSDIIDKSYVQTSNVSFENSLILKMPLKNIKMHRIDLLQSAADIIFFIDDEITNKVSSYIINFLNNFGDDYKFNIIKYGIHTKAFSEVMVKKNHKQIINASKFLHEEFSADPSYNFIESYLDVFGSKSQKNLIKEFDINRTFAICVGSISSDKIITSKKVTTFLIDPSQKYDTYSFAIKNNFTFVGPFIKSDIENSFYYLLRLIKTHPFELYSKSNENSVKMYTNQSKYIKEVRDLYQFLKPLYQNKLNCHEIILSTDNLKEFLKESNLPFELLKNPIINKILKEKPSLTYLLDQIENQYVSFLVNDVDPHINNIYISPRVIPTRYEHIETNFAMIRTNMISLNRTKHKSTSSAISSELILPQIDQQEQEFSFKSIEEMSPSSLCKEEETLDLILKTCDDSNQPYPRSYDIDFKISEDQKKENKYKTQLLMEESRKCQEKTKIEQDANEKNGKKEKNEKNEKNSDHFKDSEENKINNTDSNDLIEKKSLSTSVTNDCSISNDSLLIKKIENSDDYSPRLDLLFINCDLSYRF